MLIGNEQVSIEVLIELLETKSKFVHGLVKTDIEPKDRQNFTSCLKLSSDDVLSALEDINNSRATRVYLQLLRSVVIAYIEHDTSIVDRIYHGCKAVNLPSYDTIENTIHKAFNDAYDTLSELEMNIALQGKKKATISQVSSFARSQFEKKSKIVSYDEYETYSSDDEPNDDPDVDANLLLKDEEENSSEDEDNLSSISASGRSQFHGMRVTDTVSPSLSSSYFCVEIDGKKKYMHKQTACWLLTDDKAVLSSDRLKRVQQSNR
ncbi:unnamed protein product [Rotaria sp. Silwood1]|nr:unnamed protein product [Rotaria sp. Silwood1]